MLAFTALVSVLTGVLFGLATLAGLRRNADLRSGGKRSTTGRMSAIRTTLVATEVALLVVLVAADLMVKSLMRMFDNDPGLDPSSVLVLTMSLPQPDFARP